MMVTEEFITKMKAFVEVVDDTLDETKGISDQIGQQEDRPAAEEPEEKVDEGAEQEPSDNPVEEENNEVPALVPQEDEMSDDEVEEAEEESDDEDEEESDNRVRRSDRIRAGIKRPDRYAVHTKLRQGKHNSQVTNEAIEAAEGEEIKLVFEELKAVEVVRKEDIPVGIPAFNSQRTARMTSTRVGS
jgi:hypothetical protein